MRLEQGDREKIVDAVERLQFGKAVVTVFAGQIASIASEETRRVTLKKEKITA